MFTRQRKTTTAPQGYEEFDDSFYAIDHLSQSSINPTVHSTQQTTRQSQIESPRPTLSHIIGANDISPEDLEEIDQTFGLDKLASLTEMGFKPKYAWLALRQSKGNVEEALTFCIEFDTDTLDRLVQQFEASRPRKQKSLDTKETKKSTGIFGKLFGSEKKNGNNSPPTPPPPPNAQVSPGLTAAQIRAIHTQDYLRAHNSNTSLRRQASSIPSQNPNFFDANGLTTDEDYEVELATALSATEVDSRQNTTGFRSNGVVANPQGQYTIESTSYGASLNSLPDRGLPPPPPPGSQSRRSSATAVVSGPEPDQTIVAFTPSANTVGAGFATNEATASSTVGRTRPPPPPPAPPKPPKRIGSERIPVEDISSLKSAAVFLAKTQNATEASSGVDSSANNSPVTDSWANGGSVAIDRWPTSASPTADPWGKTTFTAADPWANGTSTVVTANNPTKSVAAVISSFPTLLPSSSKDIEDFVNELSTQVDEHAMQQYQSMVSEPAFTTPTENEKQDPWNWDELIQSNSAPYHHSEELRRSLSQSDEPISILSRGNSIVVDKAVADEIQEHEILELEKSAIFELQLEPYDIKKASSMDESHEKGNVGEEEALIVPAESAYSSDTEVEQPQLHVIGVETALSEESVIHNNTESKEEFDRTESRPYRENSNAAVRIVSDHIETAINPEDYPELLATIHEDNDYRRSNDLTEIVHPATQRVGILIAEDEDFFEFQPTEESSGAIPSASTAEPLGASFSNYSTSTFAAVASAPAAPVNRTQPPSANPVNSRATAPISTTTSTIPSSSISSSTAAAPSSVATPYLIPFKRRKYLPYQVFMRDQKWVGIISMKQTNLKRGEPSPQGNRPDQITLGPCATRELCADLCESMAPPTWMSKEECKECSICSIRFTMFNKGHHCRNCGFLVCMNCSDKIWPSNMLPTTYHSDEKIVRVCHSCHYLTEVFISALRDGDEVMCRTIYASGNINVYNPFTVYTNHAYPVHCAVSGGNMNLVRWLIDEKKCSIIDRNSNRPLTTANGLTPFAIAAMKGHIEVMNYLVHEKKASVTEITDVSILQRALHVALRANEPLPHRIPGTGGSGKNNVVNLEDVVELPNNEITAANTRRGSSQFLNFRAQGINLQSTALLPLNGITGATISYPIKNRVLSAHAMIGVNQFLERQRTSAFTTQLPPPTLPSSNRSTPQEFNFDSSPSIGTFTAAPSSSTNRPIANNNNIINNYNNNNHHHHIPESSAARVAVPHIQHRPVSIALSEVVTADLVQPGNAIGGHGEDEPIEAEAFLADDVIFTVNPH